MSNKPRRSRNPQWYEHPEAQDYLRRAQRELLPKIEESATVLAIWSGGPDAKMALEIGYAIMLDKPLIALVMPGTEVPAKMAAVVDRFVEYDGHDMKEAAGRLHAAMVELGLDRDN